MNKSLVERLIEDYGYEDVVIFKNPSYENAFIGITNTNQAVYDYDKMIEHLMDTEEMTYEEAADFIKYNASFFSNEGEPIILTVLNE